MRVALIGANGFVGSAFARLLAGQAKVELLAVTRQNYESLVGTACDLVIEAACNARKFLADENPRADFEASVAHRLRTLFDFPAPRHLHLSSVDVYHDLTSPASTGEETAIDPAKTSTYGFHKLLAEQLVQHHAREWLIIRLAGMVGPGLKKNPVFDILERRPLRIHPDSQYQFMHTDAVAGIVWNLWQQGHRNQPINVCGRGLISPREIARIANLPLPELALPPGATPRVVHANVDRAASMLPLPDSTSTIAGFVAEARSAAS